MGAAMKKAILVALAAMALLQINPLPVQAGRGGHGGYSGHRGYSGHGGYRGHSNNNVHWGVDLWLGPGLFGPYYPYYSYYPYSPYYPYYTSPPVVIQQQPQPQEYIVQPAPERVEQSYWYYCKNPEGYYPYVERCPSGWMKVVPTPPPTE